MNDEPTAQFHSTHQRGYSDVVSSLPGRVLARKLAQDVGVEFATDARTLQTAEGLVHVQSGDAIVTGSSGEQWRVSRARFDDKYRAVPPTVAGSAGRYSGIRNTIMAVHMTRPFEVVLEDDVSRLAGEAGDWLVDYGDGSLGIVAQHIFSNTYEIVG